MSDPLATLLEHPGLWRGAGAGLPASVPTGFRRLDERLPGGGWPLDTLVELLLPATGIGEVELLVPLLRALSAAGPEAARWIAWLNPPYLPYAPALAGSGLDPGRMLVVRPRAGSELPWVMEQTLRSSACAAALGWVNAIGDTALRRLQLAAAEGRSLGLLFRPAQCRDEPSPAALRLALTAHDGSLDVEILKSRGGMPARIAGLLTR